MAPALTWSNSMLVYCFSDYKKSKIDIATPETIKKTKM